MVGGDGRFFCKEAVQKILKLAHGNKVAKVVVGQNGILSTPAVSAIIRGRQARGGIILSASHNPGGPTGDFGIKYNARNGGPAPSSMTNKIFEVSKSLAQYATSDFEDIDLSEIRTLTIDDSFTVEVVDSVQEYLDLMKTLFDFDQLRGLVSSPSFRMRIDCLHGSPIFVSEVLVPM